MSTKIPQLADNISRLDVALGLKMVPLGTRFLYTINGSGKCYEGTLLEVSPEGHVRLNSSGIWDWPPEVRIEEILSHPQEKTELQNAQNEKAAPVQASPPPFLGNAGILSKPGPSPVPLPSAKPSTTKPKRYL